MSSWRGTQLSTETPLPFEQTMLRRDYQHTETFGTKFVLFYNPFVPNRFTN